MRQLPYFIFCIACAVFLCASPESAACAVTRALSVCVRTVIPSLFPFMIVNSLVVNSGFASILGAWLSRPVRALFAVGGAGGAAFILGAVAGFPLGAECVAHMYKLGQCTKDEAERMTAFCNNTGPAFLVGGIGSGMWGRPEIGWLLYITQLAAAVIVGVALRFTRAEESSPSVAGPETVVTPAIFTSAITGASVGMLKICGFIAAFSVLCDMIRCAAAGTGGTAAAVLFSFLEITSGSAAAADAGGNAGIALTAAAVGWSGLSVHMQTASVLPKELSLRRYAAGKAAQGILSGLMAYAVLLLYLF